MKHIFTLIFLSFHTLNFAHETYFAFAEMEYDDKCSCLEISIKVSSHDLNEIAENDIENYKSLESALIDKKQIKEITDNIILKGFQISQAKIITQLFYEGFELNNDGNCYFFFKSEEIEPETINVRFDLFMGIYTEQQNKIIYRNSNDINETYGFFIFKRQTDIKL